MACKEVTWSIYISYKGVFNVSVHFEESNKMDTCAPAKLKK